jgi:ABC-type transport system involved in cytochrome c biogenesis permease component
MFWEETRRRLRGGRGFVVLSAYVLALLFLLFALTMLNPPGSPETWSRFGQNLWKAFFWGQLVVMFLIAPAIAASGISAEREHGTLDLLFLTRQTTFALVMGKFLGAVTQMLVVIISGIPVVAVIFFYGGVSPEEVAKGYLTILLISLFYASLGFLASCLFARVASAVAWAYGFMLIHILGLPLVLVLFLVFFPDFGGNEGWLVHLSGPLEHLTAYLGDADQAAAYWPGLISTVVQIGVVLTACIIRIRRVRGASGIHLLPAAARKRARSRES